MSLPSLRLSLGAKPKLGPSQLASYANAKFSSGSSATSCRALFVAELRTSRSSALQLRLTSRPSPLLSLRSFSSSPSRPDETQSGSLGNLRPASSSLKPYYVTTPIFYVNADPHIGHLHSSLVADVLARYHDLRYAGYSAVDINGDPVSDETIKNQVLTQGRSKSILSTGTDEHGLKIQKVAEAAGEDPKLLCDRISRRFKDLATASGVDFVRFIRTTDDDHREAVHHLWRDLEAKGHIYKGSHEGWYAVSDEAFYPETQIHEVVDPTTGHKYMESIETGSRVEWSSEENYKFRLSAFRDELIRWLESDPNAIQPARRHAEVLNELKSGLSDLSISRPSSRLSWGIPVPGDPDHSIYVWMDALTNYLTVAGYPWKGGVAQQSSWPADVHVVGKDIVRFHAVYWPAFLLAAGLPLPKTVLAHSHWTMNKAKMSKSRGNVANPFDAIDMFGLDTIRFFLMRVGGNFASDSDYSPAVLLEFYRKFLQGQLGNLLSRISGPKIQGRLARFVGPSGSIERNPSKAAQELMSKDELALFNALESALIALPGRVDELMSRFEFAKALELIIESTIGQTNELVHHIAPWSAKTPDEVVLEVVVLVSESLRICATLLRPFMPGKMDQLLDVLQVEHSRRVDWDKLVQLDSSQSRLCASIPHRSKLTPKIEPLFPRLEVDSAH